MKLIENLSLIKFLGSENTLFQGKPVQLLHASSQHQPFTLINSGPAIDISDLNNVKMSRNGHHQASLELPANSNTQLSNQTSPTQTRLGNLNIASQVIQLTVVSSLPNPLSANVTSQQTTPNQTQLNTQQAIQPGTAQSSSNVASANPSTSNQASSPQTQTTASTSSNPSQAQTNVSNNSSLGNNQTNATNATKTTQNTVSNSVNQSLTNTSANATNNASQTQPQGPTELTYASLNKRPLSNLSLTNNSSTPTASNQAAQSSSNTTSGGQTPHVGSNTQPTQTPASNQFQHTQGQHILQVTDGQSEFQLISQQALKKGDTLRVFVDANHQLQSLPAKQANESMPLQTQALRQSLPKQLAASEMNSLINQLQRISQTEGADLPPRTQQALQQLLQHLPNLPQVTGSPEAMKQAMQTSGTFAESLLLNDQKNQIPADFKLNLERLKDSQDAMLITRTTSTIPTEQIANAIERITTNQLRHLSEPGQLNSQMYPLHIEVPIKDQQQQHRLVHIEIDQDNNQTQHEKHERRWLVKLQFDFEETGRFDARTSIQGNKVGILFAAESLDTVQKLQHNMPILKDKLNQKDIEIERLDAFQAKLVQTEKNKPSQQSLIDVRT